MNFKQLIPLGVFLLFFYSSCTDTPPQEATAVSSPQEEPVKEEVKRKYQKNTVYGKASVTLEDGANYTESFVRALSESTAASSFLLKNDGTMIIDQTDQIQLPKFLTLKDWYRFRATKGDLQYSLEVQRQDHTQVVFRYVVFEKSNRLINVSKVIELGAHFFLGDESDEDDQTKESYLATEYSGGDNSCQYALRIGGEVGALKAKLIRTCQDETQDITLDEAPTLRQAAR